MPRYDYRCLDCSGSFTYTHSMKEELEECYECSGSLIKEISFSTIVRNEVSPKAGSLVKQHIQDAAVEISKEKKKLKNRIY